VHSGAIGRRSRRLANEIRLTTHRQQLRAVAARNSRGVAGFSDVQKEQLNNTGAGLTDWRPNFGLIRMQLATYDVGSTSGSSDYDWWRYALRFHDYRLREPGDIIAGQQIASSLADRIEVTLSHLDIIKYKAHIQISQNWSSFTPPLSSLIPITLFYSVFSYHP